MENVSHEQYQEWIALYALGSLGNPESKWLKAHLAQCAACLEVYRQELVMAGLLAQAVENVEPSPETKLKLFARVDADLAQRAAPADAIPLPRPAPKRAWFRQPVFAFAVVAVLALLAIGGWMLWNRPSPEQQQIAAILNDPNVRQVALAGTQDAPNASAKMYMVPGHSVAVLKVNGLAQLPADKGYEFWFIRNQSPEASEVFTVNADGSTTVLVKASDKVENYNAWGVTIEPKAGVPKPTGALVILGGL